MSNYYYTVVHNGYEIKLLDTKEEVKAFIKSCIEPTVQGSFVCNNNFEISMFANRKVDKARMVIYQYVTMYTEQFLVMRMNENTDSDKMGIRGQ